MKKIILLAAVIYFLIAPFTYHPDTKLVLYYPTLNNSKVWNIYSYLDSNKDDAPKFHYPPMHYWVLKAELPLVTLIGGKGIVEWFKSGGNMAFNNQNIFLYNFASKFPLILLVLLSGFYIYKIVLEYGYNKKIAVKAATIWFFNPLTIYSAIIMGQNDILAIFPFILGMYFYKRQPFLAFLLFGIGGSIKNYPLIWAIILGLVYVKATWIKKVSLVLTSFLVYIATMLPFLSQSYFRQEVLYSGLSVRMFDGMIDIGFGDKLLLVPLLLVFIALIGIKREFGRSLKGITTILLTSTLIILGLTHFHPQWFIWIMPFASILLSISKDKSWWFWFLLPSIAIIILLFEDKFLYWGLFSPINPNLMNLPYINETLRAEGVDVLLLNNICHSIIAGIAFYWLWILGKQKYVKNR